MRDNVKDNMKDNMKDKTGEKRKKKRKRKRRSKVPMVVFFSILELLVIGGLVAVRGFTVQEVIISGNVNCSEETVKEWVLKDEYSWNSLYVYLKNKFVEPEDIPFVDTVEVSLKSPHILEIQVYEKGLLGSVYMEALGQNAYFDKDGLVVEMSSDVIEGVPRVTGLDVDEIVLYEKLPIKESNVLKNLLSLTQSLKKYSLVPESIHYSSEGSYTLSYGDITVMMGQAQNLNEKIQRLSIIMPQLEGERGTLHLEGWTEDTTDISFEKAE